MANDRGTSFPVAGATVVALFLSTVFLAPRGYDFLRQSDDSAKQLQLSKPVVEARLWEDPLEAQRRHSDKLKKLREPPPDPFAFRGGSTGPSRDPHCVDARPDTAEGFKKQFKDDPLTVIAAMLPGDTFVGSEETRRRFRYALLAGLNAAGYIPDDSERMSLLQVPRCASFTGCPAAKANGKEKDKANRWPSCWRRVVGVGAQQGPPVSADDRDATAQQGSAGDAEHRGKSA